MYPFVKRGKDRLSVRLNKELYKRELIERAARQEPNSVISINTQGKYYLVELKADDFGNYFDFLNYLIYLSRNK